MRPRLLLLAALLLAGCGDDQTAERPTTGAGKPHRTDPRPPRRPPTQAPGPATAPDPGRVAVPEHDPSPPSATIALESADGTPLAEASQPEQPSHPDTVTLDEPALRGTATARDADGGVARVRISLREELACRAADGAYRLLRTRYFPPPQVERIRSNPGAPLPTRATRSLPLSLSESRCHAGRLAAVYGELWGEAINGSGLEAVTPHLRFVYDAY